MRQNIEIDPSPCDDCSLVDVCAAGLACAAFRMFASFSKTRMRPEHWATLSREPSRAWYVEIYGSDPSPGAFELTDDHRLRIRAARKL